MAVPTTGPLRISTLATTYGGSGTRRLGRDYQRGYPGSWVHGNGAGNISTNHSAGVDGYPGRCRLSSFRGGDKGYTYTNSGTLISGPSYYYHSHYAFGPEFTSSDWPKKWVNNGTIKAANTGYYAFVIYCLNLNGTFEFVNNSEVQGAGGVGSSAVGQHAIYIYSTVAANKPKIRNNGAIRGGGGAGGAGGTGGTGGTGYTQTASSYWNYTDYMYSETNLVNGGPGAYYLRHANNGGGPTYIAWATGYVPGAQGVGGVVSTFSSSDGYTYEQGPYVRNLLNNNMWQVRRRNLVTTYTNNYFGGGAGGAGGAGGRGQGGDGNAAGGAGGAAGAGGGTNAGSGGYGGTGGTGGTWGATGNTGNTGATGNTGNWSGGAGGSAGGGGGGGGDGIYANSPWSLLVGGTINGSYERGVQPS